MLEAFYPSEQDEAEIAWLRAEKDRIDTTTGKPVTWEKLGQSIGINHKTLSLIANKNYGAPYHKHCAQIRAYREQQQRRAEYQHGLIKHPGFVELPTSRRIWSLLSIAHTGKMVLICAESGYSKSYIARRYKAMGGANVFMTTLNETTGKLNPMVSKLLEAVGGQPRGSSSFMSGEIERRLEGRKALVIVDEAGCGNSECIEQLRHLYDATGCGIAMLGNRDLHMTIAGAKRSFAFARVNSRIGARLPLDITLEEDLPMYLDAYGIDDEQVRKMLTRIGLNRRSGGLREIDQTLENASMIASSEKSRITVDHIVAAQESRGLQVDGTPK